MHFLKAIRTWKITNNVDFKINNFNLSILLYADNQTLHRESLQKKIYNLDNNIKMYNLIISSDRTKLVTFQRKFTIRENL